MMVLALDQAPRFIGSCYGKSKHGVVPTWNVTGFDSYGENTPLLIRAVIKWLTPICERIKPDVIYYEDFFLNGNTITFREQACVAAAIEVVAQDVGADCFDVRTELWRKRALGKHNKPKWAVAGNEPWLKEAAMIACAERGWLIADHNAAEAALIWDYGCAHCDTAYRAATKPNVERVLLERENKDRAFAGK
jgi:hypothetical protein